MYNKTLYDLVKHYKGSSALLFIERDGITNTVPTDALNVFQRRMVRIGTLKNVEIKGLIGMVFTAKGVNFKVSETNLADGKVVVENTATGKTATITHTKLIEYL